jgi:hypothetical protein
MCVCKSFVLLACSVFLAGSLVLHSNTVNADSNDSTTTAASLDDEIQSLKKQVLALNRSLFMLEEELLFPSSTQIAVFVSMDIGDFFSLDSVQLKIDNKVVSNYLYTRREVEALHRGGVQRLYMGNLKTGEHELVAIYTGKGPNGRDYRRGAELVVNKNLGARFVELKIIDNESSEQPDFSIKEWE